MFKNSKNYSNTKIVIVDIFIIMKINVKRNVKKLKIIVNFYHKLKLLIKCCNIPYNIMEWIFENSTII